MDNKQLWIILGVGVVVILIIYKLMPQTTQEIQTLVPVGKSESGPDMDEQIFRTAQLGAFQSLLDLGKTQTIGTTELGLEGIRSTAQEKALNIQSQTALSLQELQSQLQLGLAGIQSETALGIGAQQLQLGREQIGGQLEAIRVQGANRAREIEQQLGAVMQAGQLYRKQSLERQGTILNAILSSFGAQPVYSYESAFGGPRGPSILQQITGLVGGVGKFFGLG